MKGPIFGLGAGLFIVLVFYLFGAFIAWDIHPGHWLPEGRLFLGFITLVVGAAVCAVVAEEMK